jgi:hypothetical protein
LNNWGATTFVRKVPKSGFKTWSIQRKAMMLVQTREAIGDIAPGILSDPCRP